MREVLPNSLPNPAIPEIARQDEAACAKAARQSCDRLHTTNGGTRNLSGILAVGLPAVHPQTAGGGVRSGEYRLKS